MLAAILILCGTTATFASCSKDDDSPVVTPAFLKIAVAFRLRAVSFSSSFFVFIKFIRKFALDSICPVGWWGRQADLSAGLF